MATADVPLRLVTDLRIGFEGPGAHATKTLRQGERGLRGAVLATLAVLRVEGVWAEHPPPANDEEAFERVERTADFWREWINRGEFPEHPWQSYLQRSALTLKGLTYSPTGALLAAATTSLPETIGGERNWDYRYTWIRDGTFMLWGLYTLGFAREANDFFYFIADVAAGKKDLQIMYGIGGEHELTEKTLDHLSGYEGSRPGAHRQRRVQPEAARRVGRSPRFRLPAHRSRATICPSVVWPILKRAVECAHCELEGTRPRDLGGARRAAAFHLVQAHVLGRVRPRSAPRASFTETGILRRVAERRRRDQADICANGVDSRGVFVQHYGSTALDASVLLIPLVRFLPPDDPRVRATVMAIAEELTEDGLVLRYRIEETDDGLQRRGGHLHDLLVLAGLGAVPRSASIDRARELCEKMLSYASPLQLYAEEIDPRSGRHLGNFPQAFTHLALINAVMHVINAESGASNEFVGTDRSSS